MSRTALRAVGYLERSVAKMTTMKANLTAAILMMLAVTLVLTGCDQDSVALAANKADKVVLTYPKGGTIVTNVQLIGDLVDAMRCAKVDNTPYDTAMTLKIEFLAGDTNLATISAGGPLFRLGKTQYHDRTGKFQQAIQKLTERSKAPNQASDATSEAAPGAASSSHQR
jgi:hypothetical protein